MNLVIVDLGCGNIGSVALAFQRLGVVPTVSGAAEDIRSADRVVLPGVGSAGYAMERIGTLGLAPVLRGLRQPALGICLGMQLLFEASEEHDGDCLGLFPGRVRKIEPASGRPVPHMGWSRLTVDDNSELGLRTGDYAYFAHSFACDPGAATVATAEYGRSIPAVAQRGNWLGAQFHPERSGGVGAGFLRQWLER